MRTIGGYRQAIIHLSQADINRRSKTKARRKLAKMSKKRNTKAMTTPTEQAIERLMECLNGRARRHHVEVAVVDLQAALDQLASLLSTGRRWIETEDNKASVLSDTAVCASAIPVIFDAELARQELRSALRAALAKHQPEKETK